jgi:threonine dehydrogenase-like Zn-dependent dehydrogenase
VRTATPTHTDDAERTGLRNVIHVEPSWLVSHQLPLSSAAEAYEHFDRRDKVVLSPVETHGGSGAIGP